MKAVISKHDLVSLIGKIQSIIANKPAIPVLSNVLIEAQNGQLILSATDLTTSMKCQTDAKVVEEGSIALPAKRFFHLVRELTSPQIKISCLNEEVAEITSLSSHFKINGMSKSEFPSLPDIGNAIQININSSTLKDMLSRTYFSAAREDSRYVLNGIYMNISNNLVTFIATDGKRLAKIHSNIDVDPSLQGSYILPLKAVEEMIKMLTDDLETVTLSLTHDKIFLETANLTLMTKLLSGQYPDVEKVIPENANVSIIIHREELITLLRQVSLFTSDSSGSVKFVFDQNQLQLTALSSDIGEGNVTMPVDYSKEPFEIAFNPYYFMDILRHSKDETITFSIQDAYNPGMITDSTNAIFVIMPMRLSDSSLNNSKYEPEDAQIT
ncbi:MAG: DNA polymerase III subunit beta [Chlamydiae bacterium RIFCSPHIGHO2_12_FULL_27_8]|nr:MAG: DNA polymerase III subunit beta [Chlamydiae bacterium RIFCSPHIGHO2_12_FULL_27_8]OGN64882.1 MAG: DNA polymerase III subunit beta [Chlamydiae bacterium RIFCSPLOWO2_01_FULL_28_7]